MSGYTKAIIGFGSIWGLWAFGAVVMSAFTIGNNDTAPEIIAMLLYGFTILPACILSIWHRKAAAYWLLALSFISAFGFLYQEAALSAGDDHLGSLARDALRVLFFAAIPGLIGALLLRADRRETISSELLAQIGKRKG
jgi:hypothetical protein